MNIRGHEKRVQICKDYDIVPILRTSLLHSEKHSDAEATITKEYYVFLATHKTTGKQENITCGMPAANDLIQILGIKPLPPYNPLMQSKGETSTRIKKGENDDKGTINNPDRLVWDTEMRQFYDACMIMIIGWSADRPGPLLSLADYAIKCHDKKLRGTKLESLNAIIGKDGKKRSLGVICHDIRKKEPDFKYYKFDLLEKHLELLNVKSNF